MEEPYDISLGLGIGGRSGGGFISKQGCIQERKSPVQFLNLFPLCSREDEEEDATKEANDRSGDRNRISDEEDDVVPGTAVNGGNNNRSGQKKKLRLTTHQATLLEKSFRQHHTLNLTQKQELANQLNLRPRQVEVWFQNRRARIKLKQTEVNCALLKKCCENLSDENRRLKKELQELRSLKPTGSPFYTQPPRAAVTLSMCPSCERIPAADHSKKTLGNFDAIVAKKSFHIKDSSMAC